MMERQMNKGHHMGLRKVLLLCFGTFMKDFFVYISVEQDKDCLLFVNEEAEKQ